MNKLLVSAALASIFAVGAVASAQAADMKCVGGKIEAGKNACKTSKHACKGHATTITEEDFTLVATQADCDKQGGKVETK